MEDRRPHGVSLGVAMSAMGKCDHPSLAGLLMAQSLQERGFRSPTSYGSLTS